MIWFRLFKRERKGKGERQTDRQTDGDGERQTGRDTETDTDRQNTRTARTRTWTLAETIDFIPRPLTDPHRPRRRGKAGRGGCLPAVRRVAYILRCRGTRGPRRRAGKGGDSRGPRAADGSRES